MCGPFPPAKVSLRVTKIRKFQSSLSKGRKIQDFRKKIKISTRKFFENRRKFSKKASLRVTFSLKFGLPKGWFSEVGSAHTHHPPTLVPPPPRGPHYIYFWVRAFFELILPYYMQRLVQRQIETANNDQLTSRLKMHRNPLMQQIPSREKN